MKGEVETQFSLSGLLLHTQPLHSSEQHTRAHLEFSSHFGHTFYALQMTLNERSILSWTYEAKPAHKSYPLQTLETGT